MLSFGTLRAAASSMAVVVVTVVLRPGRSARFGSSSCLCPSRPSGRTVGGRIRCLPRMAQGGEGRRRGFLPAGDQAPRACCLVASPENTKPTAAHVTPPRIGESLDPHGTSTSATPEMLRSGDPLDPFGVLQKHLPPLRFG